MFGEALAVAKYRNQKLDWMLERVRSHDAEGVDRPCVARTILGENLNKAGLSDEGLMSVINSMISSGLGKFRSSSSVDGC